MIKHKIAKGLILWFMQKMGYLGWTSFWNTIYYIDEKSMNDESIRRHELKHIEQINRDGILKFSIMYLYYAIIYGYRENPYEVEARSVE